MAKKETKRRSRLRVLAFFVLTAAVLFTAVAASAGDVPHVVVIGEVQGSAATVTKLLTHLGLADAQGHWAGGGEPAALDIDIDNGVYTAVTLTGREVLIGDQAGDNVKR